MADKYTLLQNRWYNALAKALLLSRSTFQLAQPWTPLQPSDDALWPSENVIPPLSLTFNPALSGSPTFFDEYVQVVNELQFPASTFEAAIGAANYEAWMTYVASIDPPPGPSQLPGLFRRWAMINAPAVAAIGTADLASMALITTAQQALAPYLGPDALPADFTGTFEQLRQMLASSQGVLVTFDSSGADGDVADTWTGGADRCFWGLWAGAEPASRLSTKFAMSDVTVLLVLDACTVWPSVPGAWYNSSMLNVAYSNRSSPPWPPEPDPSWEAEFGPDGRMLREVASLVAGEGLAAVVTSNAAYSASEQQVIRDYAARGLWPFFLPAGGASSTEVKFEDRGMVISTVVPPYNPFIIGGNVLPTPQFLGHI